MNKEILKKKLEEINIIIDSNYQDTKHLGVLTGISGIALFKFYYAKYSDNNEPRDTGLKILELAMQNINEGYDFATYCTGISGFSWVLDHLESQKFIDIDNDDLLSKLDNNLNRMMVHDMKNNNYDFLHGAIGYAFYFLNRYKCTYSKELKERYKNILLEFISMLNTTSIDNGNSQLKWMSILASNNNAEVYNLSLSHGMSSIIGILTKMHEYKDFKTITIKLLNGAINYILSFKRKHKLSLFPIYITKENEPIYVDRIAWCYGDLGVAVQIWHASKSLKDEHLQSTAIEILKHTAKKTVLDKTLVVDAGICHGSFGNRTDFS